MLLNIGTSNANPIMFYTGGIAAANRRWQITATGALHGFPFVFANIATVLTADGELAYCSDCTIANPCAGGGTGAIAKRLNGVNVCN